MKERVSEFYSEMSRAKIIFCFAARAFIIVCIFISLFVFKSGLKALESFALFLCSFLFEGYYLVSKKNLPERSAPFECAYIAFLVLAGIFGSVFSLFEKIATFDVFTHSISGILCAEFILLVLFGFSKKSKIKFSAASLFAFSFLFTAALASLWEIWEFTAFSLIKYSDAGAFTKLLAQFGLNIAPTLKSVNSGAALAIEGDRYDTFSDIFCALFFSALYSIPRIISHRRKLT